MKKEVMILTGAGQIGMAIARRMGYGKKIVVGDLNPESSEAVCRILNEAGFDAVPVEMNLSSRESILNLIAVARKHGEISMLVNTAGVSPSQASIETILKVDLYGLLPKNCSRSTCCNRIVSRIRYTLTRWRNVVT